MLSLPLAATALLNLAGSAQAGERVVFVYGEDEYGSYESVPAFAAQLEVELGLECVLLPSEDRRLPDLSALEDAHLLVLFLRFREADEGELEPLERWLDAGRPAIALRTTSHAFRGRKGWFPPRFGGHYKGHAPNDWGTRAVAAVAAAQHPLLRGVPRVVDMGYGGTYDTQPLSDGAEVLLFGRSGDLPAQPVAWTYAARPGQRLFYTSLGSRENFGRDAFRTLLANAVLWGLGREVPAGGALGGEPHPPLRGALFEPLPAPPLDAPEDAPEDVTVLFGGGDLRAWRHWDPSVEPRAIEVDERADTSAGGPLHDAPRWRVEGGALVARPGFGDLLTREELGDVHLHLDFLVPREPAWVPDDFRGASGVYLAGRYEVALLDSWRKDTTDGTCGALFGQLPPAANAARPPGTWQTLDLTYTQRPGEPPRISAWLNDVRVLTDATPEEATAYGILEPVPGSVSGGEVRHVADEAGSAECDWGRSSFALYAAFKSTGRGTLVSKCPAQGQWVPDAKALFLRGGRLVYDIGWVGAMTSERRWNDGKWHRVVLTSDDGFARMYVDGECDAEREDFAAADEPEFRLKIGDANENFGGTYAGELGEVRFYDRRLSPDEAALLSAGETDPGIEPVWDWERPEERAPVPVDGVLRGPIRLQADCSEVRFANIWVRPLGEVDHAALVASLDDAALERGKAVYSGLCVACHGPDGTRPTNPKARPFALGVLENGRDPLSLFHTVTSGYRDMPSNAWLTPAQRYDVIHYVRESFLRERNPSQHFAVTDAYLNALPKGRVGRVERGPDELPPRDYGPALASSLGSEVGTCLTVRLDEETTIAYDLQVMESPGAWVDGFLNLASTQHYQQRGEGLPSPAGTPLAGLEGWGWGHDGALDWDRSRRPERGPLPREWLDYHGRYVHGERVVLSYAIDGREVLEMPGVDRTSGLPVITHRLRVGPGENPLLLKTCSIPDGVAPLVLRFFDEVDPGRWRVAWAMRGDDSWCAYAVTGDGPFDIDLDGPTLSFPPSDEPAEVWILRLAGNTDEERSGFRIYLDNVRERPVPPSPLEYTSGGPARWPEELVTRGVLGQGGAYVMDTLTLPPTNPWNAWIRTSALDFFEDGRCAVATYGGDVWIVSGIDGDLDELRWRRFAAGMFEPMGLRVIDGVVYVTCRDRIVRLHDLNGDGEADFYESFFADPDVTATFHAFNFDLQSDAQGYLYYAKSGQYTNFALPGAVLKIAPDGRSHEVFCTGFRTPNGMGMSPDGRPLVSDNQGNWIPASKVSLTQRDGFYGVFKSIDMNSPGEQTREDFDQPAIWMPQGLDSSSGGQLWVDDPRWGPLAGRYVHTSFGKGWMYVLAIDETGPLPQGAVWRMPFQFSAGIQRARVNPADGQVYTVGMSGWQGPEGGADGCLQRVRYTGEPATLLLDARARPEGVELTFSGPLERVSAGDPGSFEVRRWNYRWASSYGSAHYSLDRPGEEGEDSVEVRGARLDGSGRKLLVELSDMRSVNQLVLRLRLTDARGETVAEEVYLTVNGVSD